MLKISKQTREAYIRTHDPAVRCHALILSGDWDSESCMQALEAFRRDTLDEAKSTVDEMATLCFGHGAFDLYDTFKDASAAIEALKDPSNEHP